MGHHYANDVGISRRRRDLFGEKSFVENMERREGGGPERRERTGLTFGKS